MPSSRRLTRLACSTVLGLALVPAAASAGPLVADAPSCAAQSFQQVFLPWGDVANYTLAPGGAAESADGWTLGGGAAPAAGNEPWQVHSAADAGSLRLPAGSSALTATICVGIGHPTVRLFTRSSGTTVLSSLRVDVLFEDAGGAVHTLQIGAVAPGSAWALSPTYLVVANLLPLLPADTTPVAFRFTPQGAGTWSVDDLYVDPWRTN